MNNDIAKIMAFYQRSKADIVSALDGDGAGVIFTLPPCSPDALSRAVRQLRRGGATKMQWIQRLRLQSRSQGDIEAFTITVLPDLIQQVYRLDTGEEISCGPLKDHCMDAALKEISAGCAEILPPPSELHLQELMK